MTSETAPLTNIAATGGARAGRSRAPIGSNDTEYFVFQDDFTQSVITTERNWTTVVDASGTTLILADAPYGVLQLTAGATTDNQGSSIQTSEELFDISSGNELWFETKILLTDADQTDVFAGFTTTFITHPENSIAEDDRIGFELIEESAQWNVVCERSGVETRKVCNGTDADGLLSVLPLTVATDLTTATDPDDAAWTKLGIHISGTNNNGGGVAIFYIDDVRVATLITNIPDDEHLALAFFQLNGETANNSMYVDYVWAANTR